MAADPAHEAIDVRLSTAEGEIESLRQIKHDHANAIVVLQERVLALAGDVEELRKSVERTAAESRRQTQQLHDDLSSISTAIALLKPAVDQLRTTLLGVDEDGGVRSRVGHMESVVEDMRARLVWIQRIGIGLVALLGPEQLKHLFSMITGIGR